MYGAGGIQSAPHELEPDSALVPEVVSSDVPGLTHELPASDPAPDLQNTPIRSNPKASGSRPYFTPNGQQSDTAGANFELFRGDPLATSF